MNFSNETWGHFRRVAMAADPIGISKVVLSKKAYLELEQVCRERELLLLYSAGHKLTPPTNDMDSVNCVPIRVDGVTYVPETQE